MTNKEKYRFKDFTIDNYRLLIELALSNGFNFIFYDDDYIPERKDILWRHDVEFEPDIALRMAEIECELGVKATYFFQMHSEYYNIFDKHYSEVLKKVQNLGHKIGLHFDCAYYKINNESELDLFINIDKTYFEQVFKLKINSFSFHNTTPFTHSCLNHKYGGLINVYSSYFKNNFEYCGDSLGYWRFDVLEDVLNDSNTKHLQVLTHDANWSESVMSPRQRIKNFLFNRAQRLFEQQVNGLHSRGMLCPDDNED